MNCSYVQVIDAKGICVYPIEKFFLFHQHQPKTYQLDITFDVCQVDITIDFEAMYANAIGK